MSAIPSVIAELKRAKSKEECLKKAYKVLTDKYHGGRFRTITRFPMLFRRDPRSLWKKSGFLHCTNLNILLRELLIGSGHFHKDDVRTCWTLLWGVSPHEYAQVRIAPRQWIDVDLWAAVYGIRLGDHAHGFHTHGHRLGIPYRNY